MAQRAERPQDPPPRQTASDARRPPREGKATSSASTGRRAAAAGAALLALLSAGCATGESPAADGSASAQTAAAEPDASESPSPNGSAEASSEAPAEGEQSALSVEQVGSEPYGLTTEQRPSGTTDDVSGRLIVGPGGHLALVSADQPQLLVFGDDAEFTLRGDRPSVTAPELGTLEVGRQVELSAVEVPTSTLDGVPAGRLQGAAETALVVVAE
ncbi:hypothetical protein [Nesterenkonia halobia]|uniref:Lipoprotein n=1 Tax=Nesterenkonia halobia TaxID=37922 RepID=A0ABP6RHW0_9MICC